MAKSRIFIPKCTKGGGGGATSLGIIPKKYQFILLFPFSSLLGCLSEIEIEQMVKDAEANKDADDKIKEKIEAKNHGDSLVASLKKTVEEHGDKVSAEEKIKIETAMTDLEESLKGEDVEDIKNKTKALTEASMKLGEAVYKDMQQQAQDTAQDGPKKEEKKDDNVVDAEFEEVDNKD